MKTFEERYTAWIDGKLGDAEQAAFERELEDRSAAEGDRAAALQLGSLLRQYSPALANPEFFNHQLLERIEQDVAATKTGGGRARVVWPWLRFAIAGFAAVALGWGIARVSNPTPLERSPERGASSMAQIIDPKPLQPGISATVIEDAEDNMTVLWLDGLEYLPASYELQ
jgi:hypothetical protein